MYVLNIRFDANTEVIIRLSIRSIANKFDARKEMMIFVALSINGCPFCLISS